MEVRTIGMTSLPVARHCGTDDIKIQEDCGKDDCSQFFQTGLLHDGDDQNVSPVFVLLIYVTIKKSLMLSW